MSALQWHPSLGPEPEPSQPEAAPVRPGDDVIGTRSFDDLSWRRADCCVAGAAYRVVLPATASRPRSTSLLLCGHHFRKSTDGLRRANALVYDARGQLLTPGE